LARQARKAAALAQVSGKEDPAVQARLKQELEHEESAIQRTCEELSLEVFNINPDGHCLFSAIADQLTLSGITPASEPNYKAVRRAAADYIQSHKDDFIPFLLSGDNNVDVMSPQEFDQYCASIRDTAEWGGEPEIMALSRAYHVPIHVVQAGPPAIVKHDPGYTDAGAQSGRTAFISYHRRMYGLGEHYNSLRRKGSSL
jgi:OTU domain-containing protein 6